MTPIMKTNLLTFLFCYLPLIYHVNAYDKTYNITQILGEQPRFMEFNSYLTEAGIPARINSREGFTVLVVNNHAMDFLKGKPKDVVKKIMGTHVLWSFFDLEVLQTLRENDPIRISTLFQASGQAYTDEGVISITRSGSQVTITAGPSGGSGSHVKAIVLKQVVDRQHVVSVLEISNLIVSPGIEKPITWAVPRALLSNYPAALPPQNVPSSPPQAPGGVPTPPPQENVPPSPPAPPNATNAAPPQPPSISAPPHANAPGSPQPTPSHANAPGSPQPTPSHANAPASAPTPSHANAPGSPQTGKAPAPAHANAPAPHHQHSSNDTGSPSPSNDSEPPPPAPEPTASDSPAESPNKSYGVRIASSISLNGVLATRLFVLAFLWMA